ncbi:hypothetical protein GCM10010409_56270 [Mycolicibacterium diernhoferi]|uniref:Secreted protein n=1 Tax=Mycolicibacterium diernhoferi TaxID=1801 RepID=A0A1Q4HBH7_9MYCO|nr:hypothetical protein BRW64_15760 [Mycolicibacterium diernhoferi]OPE54117.1 hypothetical protein BV510_11945 [Mycolicibacterium diernhoferi]
MRLITLSGMAGTLALSALVCFPTAAAAQPEPDDRYANSECFYSLTAPAAVTLPGGGQAVSTEIGMTHCTGLAQSVRTTACVARPGDSGYCTTKNGYVNSAAHAPGAPSGSYTATGEGCYRLRSDLALVCVPAGPVSATF